MYPAALHRVPNHPVDSSQVFAKCMLQKQPQIIESITRSADKNAFKHLEQFVAETTTTRFQRFDRQRQLYPN